MKIPNYSFQLTGSFVNHVLGLIAALMLMSLDACSGLFFYPSKQLVMTPDQIGLPYEDVYIPSGNETIHGWYLPARGTAQGTVLFLHGNAENISTHIGSVYWLPEKGYNVLALDYRGFGKSTGTPSLPGNQQDAEQAIRYLLGRSDTAETNLFLLGQSVGGAIALDALARSEFRGKIRSIVCDSAFSSYRLIAREKIAAIWPAWPLQIPLSWLFRDDYSPIRRAAEISPTPILFIHGDQDQIVPVHHSYDLFAAAKEPKKLLIIAGGAHIEALQTERGRNAVIDFFQATGAKAAGPER